MRLRSPAWLIAPYGAALAILLLVPICVLVGVSFATYAPSRLWDPIFTLGNYGRLADGFYADMLWRTLRIAASATLITAVVAYPLAYFLARCEAWFAPVGIFMLVVPLMVSTVIRSFGWIVLLGRDGPLIKLLGLLGVTVHGDFLYSELAVQLGLIQILLPLMTLPLLAAIERIPLRAEEAAASLGASPLRVFFMVIVPLSKPGLASGAVLCFTVSLSVVITPELLGGRKVRMAGNFIYEQVLSAFNWPFAASIANILAVISMACMILLIAHLRRRHASQNGGAHA
ncbi:MAG TPA: ABC transporter permease [Bordetella sp.]